MTPPIPTAAQVAEAMQTCGLEIVARGELRVIARDSRVTLYAFQFPRGWRIGDAQHYPTREVFAKTVRDVERFVDETTLERAGVR